MEQTTRHPKADEEIELLLDERVEGETEALPDGFAARIQGACPFAPWETRQRRFWKVPALVLGLLFSSAFVLGLAPLLRLGPETAMRVWAQLIAVSMIRPVLVAVEAAPLAAKAASAASRTLAASPGSMPLLLTGAAIGLGILGLALLPALRRRRASDAAAR
jgi:hypothetical protein